VLRTRDCCCVIYNTKNIVLLLIK